MTSHFQRTENGLINKYLFLDKPLIWVEGPSDVRFYSQILAGLPYYLEPAHGGGKAMLLARALAAKDLPYVVVLDGHYEILVRQRSFHRRVVFLNRHSIENYLFEEEPICQVCSECAGERSSNNTENSDFFALLDLIETSLLELILLDIANAEANTGHDVLPKHADELLSSRPSLRFNTVRIQEREQTARVKVSEAQIERARGMLCSFLKRARLVDIIPGHLGFGLIRQFVFNKVRARSGHLPHLDNKMLALLLCMSVWSLVPTDDHVSLRRRLREAVREANRMRWSQDGVTAQSELPR